MEISNPHASTSLVSQNPTLIRKNKPSQFTSLLDELEETCLHSRKKYRKELDDISVEIGKVENRLKKIAGLKEFSFCIENLTYDNEYDDTIVDTHLSWEMYKEKVSRLCVYNVIYQINSGSPVFSSRSREQILSEGGSREFFYPLCESRAETRFKVYPYLESFLKALIENNKKFS